MDPRSGAPGGRRRLGEVLVAGRVLTETQLDEALRVQREDKGRRRRLGEVIVALGLADEVQIARALSDQLGLPFLDLGSLPIPDETLAVLPRNVALRHNAIPVTLAHDVLTVALADPTNVLALDDIRLATKLGSVRTAVATASDLQEVRGYRLPLRSPRSTLARGRALVVGDAAGLIDPVSGDGMFEGFLSSQYAADAALDVLAGRALNLDPYGPRLAKRLATHLWASWGVKVALDRFPRSTFALASTRILWGAGIRPGDTVLIASFFSLYLGSWGALEGFDGIGQ